MGRKGEHLTEFGELLDAGAVAVTDAGRSVGSSKLMRLALEYARSFDVPVLAHAEDAILASGGVMHEGVVSTRLGLRGKPAVAEEIGAARDLALAGNDRRTASRAAGLDGRRRRVWCAGPGPQGVAVTAEATAAPPAAFARSGRGLRDGVQGESAA